MKDTSTDLVSVHSKLSPFREQVESVNLPEGMNIEEMLEAVQADALLRRHAIIFVNGEPIPRQLWGRVRPLAGTMVNISIAPSGGTAKDLLRAVLQIAVIAAAVTFGGPLGGYLFGSSIAANLSLAIGTGIILTAGMFIVNAIAPIRPPEIGSSQSIKESPTYLIEQARNTPRPYQPVPVVLGRHKQVPPLGASTYTEVVGDTNHLRMIAVLGYGPLVISDIKIGDTPITDFEDYEMETREGRSNDAAITLYPDDVDEQSISVSLEPNTWVTRTAGADADQLSIDITLPRGLVEYNNKGERVDHSVDFQIRYRRVGSTSWQQPDLFGTGGRTSIQSSWVSDGKITLHGSSAEPIRHGFRWSVPNRGQYEIRVRRTSDEPEEDRVFDEMVWTAIRSFTDRSPIAFSSPLATIALDIRASDQFNRVIDELNAVVHSVVLDWDGSDWVSRTSSNPASLFRHVLQNPARERPASNDEIDLTTLQQWHGFCDTNGYEFNAIIDYQKSIWSVLADIAAAGRASPQRVDGKWSVTVDTGTQMPVQHFTPRNSSNFRMERAFEDVPQALRIRFKNREEEWRTDEMTVYNDGFSSSNAERFATIDPVGITHPDHVYKFGRFHLAQLLLRRENWRLDTDFEYIVARRGNRVKITHDVLLIGQKSARIKSLSGTDPITMEIDEEVVMEAGTKYGVSVRNADNIAVTATVTTEPGTTKTLSIASPPSGFRRKIDIGDLVAFGVMGKETIDALVSSVEPTDDLSATINMVPYQNGIYQAETGAIPPYDSGLAKPLSTRIELVITGVTSERDILRRLGSSLLRGIYVQVKPVNVTGARIEAQIRLTATGGPYGDALIFSQGPNFVEIEGVQENSTYDLRLRWFVEGSLAGGPWTELLAHKVVSTSVPPSPVTNAGVRMLSDGTRRFSWTPPLDIDLAGVQIRYTLSADDNAWADMTKLHEGYLTASPYDTFDPTAGTYIFSFRAVDDSDKLSTEVRTAAITLSAQRAPGAQILTGTGRPSNSIGTNLDVYIDLSTGIIWRKTTGSWVSTGVSIRGASGGQIFTGTGAPDASLGSNGDIYIQSNGVVWRKVAGVWVNTGVDLTGTSFRELRLYRVQNVGSTAPSRPTGGSYRFSTGVQTAPSGWILETAIPNPLGANKVLYCSLATADSKDGDLWTPASTDWTTPRIVEDLGDYNLAYGRFDTIPTTAPGASKGVPTGYYDMVDSVPPGTGTLVYIIGYRAPRSSTFTWSIPIPVLDPTSVARGRETYVVEITADQKTALEGLDDDAALPSQFVSLANDATRGDNVKFDIVRFRRSGFTSNWIWNGTIWDRLMDFIAAEEIFGLKATFENLIVEDTAIIARIRSDVQNVVVLFSSATAVRAVRTPAHPRDYIVTFRLSESLTKEKFDYIQGIAAPNAASNDYTPWAMPVANIPTGPANVETVVSRTNTNPGNTFQMATGDDPEASSWNVWKSADSRTLYMSPAGGSDQLADFFNVIGVRNPGSSASGGGGSGTGTTITVVAGDDRTIGSEEETVLGGVDIIENGQGTTTYLWERVSGTGGSLSFTFIPAPTFTAPALIDRDPDRVIVFRKTVTNNGVTESATVTITVSVSGGGGDPVDPVDPTPGRTSVTANAGRDRTIDHGTRTTLGGDDVISNGSGSTTYSWRRVSGTGGSLSSTRVRNPVFTAPTLSSGRRTIVWRKTTTNNGVSDTDDVRITVVWRSGIVSPSTTVDADAGTDRTINSGASITLGADDDIRNPSGSTTYRWRIVSGGGSLSSTTAENPRYTAPTVSSGTVTVTIEKTVTNNGVSDSDRVIITVRAITVSTRVTANAGRDQTLDGGRSNTVTLGGVDTIRNGSGSTTYQWESVSGPAGPVVRTTNQRTLTVIFPTVTTTTRWVFRKRVTNNGVSDTDTVTVTVRPTLANVDTPSIVSVTFLSSGGDPEAPRENARYRIVVEATVSATGTLPTAVDFQVSNNFNQWSTSLASVSSGSDSSIASRAGSRGVFSVTLTGTYDQGENIYVRARGRASGLTGSWVASRSSSRTPNDPDPGPGPGG